VVGLPAAAQETPTPTPQPQRPMRLHAPERGPQAARQRAGDPVRAYLPERLVALRERLSLTPDQVSKLEALAQENRKVRDAGAEAARAQEARLRDLWAADTPDVKAIQEASRTVMRARQDAQLAAVGSAAQAKAILTPEQRGWMRGWAAGANRAAMRQPGRRQPGQRAQPGRMQRPGRAIRR